MKFRALFAVTFILATVATTTATAEDLMVLRDQSVVDVSGNSIEFPTNLLPVVSVYGSGDRAVSLWANVPTPSPTEDSSGVVFTGRIEIHGSLNGRDFAWVATVVKRFSSQDRWWFDAAEPDHIVFQEEFGETPLYRDYFFRVKVFYEDQYGEGFALVFGEFVVQGDPEHTKG